VEKETGSSNHEEPFEIDWGPHERELAPEETIEEDDLPVEPTPPWEDEDESCSYSWTVHVPPDVTSIQFPELPPELAAVLPTEEGSLDVDLELLSDSTIDGYAHYRREFVNRDGFYDHQGVGELAQSFVSIFRE